MGEKPELDLLIDIAKLVKKYGSETFENLADKISTPEFSERLSSLLASTAKVARQAQMETTDKPAKKKGVRDFRTSLVAFEKNEPEKSAILLKFYDDLLAKIVLPTFRDIKTFLQDNDLPVIKATSREKAIIPLAKVLMALSIDEIKNRISSVKPVIKKDDRSLEGWSNIILDKARRTKADG